MATQFFGQFLLANGIITGDQLLQAVDYQESHNLRVGEYAVKKGYIQAQDAARINQVQKTRDVQFGAAAIELGLLTEKQLDELLRAQKADHLYLGDVVTRLGFASRQVVDEALAAYKAQQHTGEGDTLYIPGDADVAALAAHFFDLTHKLLLRLWGIQNKLGGAYSLTGRLPVRGVGVQIQFSGDVNTIYVLCLAPEIAERAVRQLFGASEASSEDCYDMTAELANVVCGNVMASLSQEGKQVEIGPPKPVTEDLDLGAHSVMVLPVVTPLGNASVAITF